MQDGSVFSGVAFGFIVGVFIVNILFLFGVLK